MSDDYDDGRLPFAYSATTDTVYRRTGGDVFQPMQVDYAAAPWQASKVAGLMSLYRPDEQVVCCCLDVPVPATSIRFLPPGSVVRRIALADGETPLPEGHWAGPLMVGPDRTLRDHHGRAQSIGHWTYTVLHVNPEEDA